MYSHYYRENEKAPVTPQEWSRIHTSVRRLNQAMPWEYTPVWLDEAVTARVDLIECDSRLICFFGQDREGGQVPMVFCLIGIEDSAQVREIREKTQEGSCKTLQLPYDILVCATLMVAEHEAPGAWEITSDGTASDWGPALNFVTTVLGDGYEIPPGVLDHNHKRISPDERIQRFEKIREARLGQISAMLNGTGRCLSI